MEDLDRAESRLKLKSLRYGVAAMSMCVGLAVAPVQGVAWADTTVGGSTSHESAPAGPADDAPADTDSVNPADSDETTKGRASSKDDPDPDATIGDTEADETPGTAEPPAEIEDSDDPEPPVDPDSEEGAPEPATEPAPDDTTSPEPVVAEPNPVAPQDDVGVETDPDGDQRVEKHPAVKFGRATREQDITAEATLPRGVGLLDVEGSTALSGPAETSVATQTDIATPALAEGTTATVETLAPSAPQPLSPLAELLQLPGRLVNAVLEIFDITSSANGPQSPISFEPINNLLFAAFRELERLFGLDRPPAVQPVVPTLTYTGPTTRPTPTVAQFLNASAAEYGLGTSPGGLVPFTVDGFQMSSTNIFSGMAARAWVTPQQQIIVAYQGTTGGTNLLFNPVIAVSQLVTDLQVIFTDTTPWAFHAALRFARRVQDEAALQGYCSDDIFVTGHSLGGWQAEYVAQQTGLAGIGFESPGINTVTAGNGADSMFVNVQTYGDPTPMMSTDLPGLQPFMPPYAPAGGSKPHFGPIVMIGDPAAATPLLNAAALWGKSIIGSIVFVLDFLGNFFQYHLPGIQAYHLDVTPDPGVVRWLGTARGPVHTGYGNLTIPQLMKAASDDKILFRP